MNIHIITAALPPQLDGIGDYAARLAAELAKTKLFTVKILAAQAHSYHPIPDVVIEPMFSVAQRQSIRNVIQPVEADRPDWVLLQYNPFSYGRWGLNPYLPLAMHRIRRSGTRIAVMVHEPFVPAHTWKTAAMTIWQRTQLWMLGRSADVICFSIESWTRRFSRWFANKTVAHLPVGSNVPLVPVARSEARVRLGIDDKVKLLGLFGTVHPGRMLNLVHNAALAMQRAHSDVRVLYIGPHGRAVREALNDIPLLDQGALPPCEVSQRFAAIDVYLAPFADGISTRRTTLMTGLQHGIATVGTRGILTDAMLAQEDGHAFLLADVNDSEMFTEHVLRLARDAALREVLGRAGQRLYQANFSWNHIARQLIEILANSCCGCNRLGGRT